jgi:glycosyltransferase involved in cell wall biosynthesis
VAEGDLAALYTLAEVFAFPSLVEGFGLPILEAMACGTPVIASSVSSMPEVAGDAALLFDPMNVDEMARVLSEVLAGPDRQAQLRARGYAQVQRFTWDAAAARVLQVYTRIDRNRAPSRVSAPASPPGSRAVRTSPGRS